MRSYAITLRSKEYRISIDDVRQRDGSVYRLICLNGKPVTAHGRYPKAIAAAIAEAEHLAPSSMPESPGGPAHGA